MNGSAPKRSVLSGDLSAIALADVLSFLSLIKKTGILTVTRSSVSKSIYWESGHIVFASSTEFRDSLGPFLVESGRISTADNLDASKLVTPTRRLGRVLVEMGHLSPNELWAAVQEQVLEIIYSLFSWSQGYFTFHESVDPPKEKIVIDLPATNIIMEGIRRYDEWNRIREKIPHERLVFEVARETGTDFLSTLTDEEKVVLSFIDGKATVQEITRSAGIGKMEVQKSLYSLLTAGVIRPPAVAGAMAYGEDTSELLEVLSTYNYIFQLLYKVTSAKIGEAAIELFTTTLREDEPNRGDLFANLNWNPDGQLPENILIANVSELPYEQRRKTLSEGLSNLLSTLVTRAGRHLSESEKTKVYQIIARVTIQ